MILTDGPNLLFNVMLLCNVGFYLENTSSDSQPKSRLNITAQERAESRLTLHTQLIACHCYLKNPALTPSVETTVSSVLRPEGKMQVR